MSRLAVAGVVVLLGGCTVAGPRPGGPAEPGPGVPPDAPVPGAPAAEPRVRVGVVVDSPSIRVSGSGRFELADDGGRVHASAPAGRAWTVRRDGDGVVAEAAGERVRVAGGLVVRPVDGQVSANGTAYRGSILVIPAASGVTAVNLLELETYLLGVVPLEIGRNRPPEEVEAVKAQAVAARTYAVRHRGRREALGFDYYGSVMDQAYGGADAEDPVSARAVRETAGQVLTYDGQPIEAYYHSTCGGRTAALEEVWPGEPRPYLRSVSDATPGGGAYCETSNRFRWTESWDRTALHAALSRGLSERARREVRVTDVRSIEITDRTPSGRVGRMVIRTDAIDDVVRGDSVRWVLRPEPGRILNSSAIRLEPRGAGSVDELVVHGSGWGHGIGMCQVGAMGRARAGQSYGEILRAYYPGTQLVRLYR